MKFLAPIFLTLATLATSAAMAQEKVVGTSPASSTTLDLYDKPGATEAISQINVIDAGMPLLIQSKQDGFYKVAIGGKEYWVRSAKVRISRDATASCGVVARASTGLTAATPGAGKDACK